MKLSLRHSPNRHTQMSERSPALVPSALEPGVPYVRAVDDTGRRVTAFPKLTLLDPYGRFAAPDAEKVGARSKGVVTHLVEAARQQNSRGPAEIFADFPPLSVVRPAWLAVGVAAGRSRSDLDGLV